MNDQISFWKEVLNELPPYGYGFIWGYCVLLFVDFGKFADFWYLFGVALIYLSIVVLFESISIALRRHRRQK